MFSDGSVERNLNKVPTSNLRPVVAIVTLWTETQAAYDDDDDHDYDHDGDNDYDHDGDNDDDDDDDQP